MGRNRTVSSEPSLVVSMTIRQGMAWTASGAALGIAGALAGARLLQSWLRGISATDPFPIAGAVLLLFATAYLACFLPAKRASHTDPIAVLRE